MKNAKIYLLSGNGGMASWWRYCLPFFSTYNPVPLELPGFGHNLREAGNSLANQANAVIEQTSPGNIIVACGVNCLPVLHAAVKKPGHFTEIILYGPIGAFLWKRRLPKLLSNLVLQTLVKFLLSRFPWLFKRRFTSTAWTPEQWALIGEGYGRCRAFHHYFNMVKPHNALTLFDTIEAEIHVVWGLEDRIADPGHAAAWEAILPRARLRFTLQPNWGHYPYIESPSEFVQWLEKQRAGFSAHTKAGRLRLAELAGLPVPGFHIATADNLCQLTICPDTVWAVRCSLPNEDQYRQSNAGLSKTYLEVPSEQVATVAKELCELGGEVIIQRFVRPKVSGVAFVRNLSAEIEWVRGHLNELVQGRINPQRIILSKLRGDWQSVSGTTNTYGMDVDKCRRFLASVVSAFHYTPLDIEWGWDGERFYLFQLRPVTAYAWRRNLTAANIEEILPSTPSRLVELAQRRAAYSIPRIYALWDTDVLNDNEPFTCTYQNASYINSDLILSRLFQWGLPETIYTEMIGGSAPRLDKHYGRFVKSIAVFVRMLIRGRRYLRNNWEQFRDFDAELDTILRGAAATRREDLVNWFLRFYVFVVQTNIVINSAIASSMGDWTKRQINVYKAYGEHSPVHRVKYETDPASPRLKGEVSDISPPVLRSFPQRAHDYLCLPGNAMHYVEMREWFRDSYTRLYHKLHFGLLAYEKNSPYWFDNHRDPRRMKSGFWQDGFIEGLVPNLVSSVVSSVVPSVVHQNRHWDTLGDVSVIYPGNVVGKVGKDILIVDSLDPGQFRIYQSFKAVIARMGGKLSHGAILLRELQIPSAIVPGLPIIKEGTMLTLNKACVSINEG